MALGVVLFAVCGYANTLDVPFVFDDLISVLGWEPIRDLGNWIGSLEGYRAHPNRYLANLTFALNFRFHGTDVAGWHAVNLVVHAVNALLVHALVRCAFRTPRLRESALAPRARAIAFVAAVLFGAHPIQTQAVTYVAQRIAALATTFYLLAVVLYALERLREERAPAGFFRAVAGYVPVMAAVVAAMRTKENALTLPLAIAAFELFFFTGSWRRRALRLAPILATLFLIPLTLLDLGRPLARVAADLGAVSAMDSTLPRLDYLLTQIPVVATYLRLLVLPVSQNLDYDFPAARSLLEARVLGSLLVLGALAALAVHAARKARTADPALLLASFGIVWFFLTLSVESSVIPIADVIFEHRAYLPSAGFFMAVGCIGGLAALRLAPRRAAAGLVLTGTAVAGVLVAATLARNEIWRDPVALWADTARKSPGKARPRYNLGLALANEGRNGEAIGEYRAALAADPRYLEAWTNLGVALATEGRLAEAADAFGRALQIKPDYEASCNLAKIHLGRADGAEQAVPLLRQAVELAPRRPEARAMLGAALNRLERYSEAVQVLGSAPLGDSVEGHVNLAVAAESLGDAGTAARALQALDALSPRDAAEVRAWSVRRRQGASP